MDTFISEKLGGRGSTAMNMHNITQLNISWCCRKGQKVYLRIATQNKKYTKNEIRGYQSMNHHSRPSLHILPNCASLAKKCVSVR